MTFDESIAALNASFRKLTEPVATIVSLAAGVVARGLRDARETQRLREEYGRAWDDFISLQYGHASPETDHCDCDDCVALGDVCLAAEDRLLEHMRSRP